MVWINHHRLFNHIKRSDTGLLLLNLLLLLVIVFIPFPTALLAQQYTAYPDQHLAALIFSGTYVILACCFYLLWNYASYRNRLLGKETDSRAVAAISRQYMFGPLLYLITFGVAFINVPVCIILNFILALFFALPGRSLRLLPKEDENKEWNSDETWRNTHAWRSVGDRNCSFYPNRRGQEIPALVREEYYGN